MKDTPGCVVIVAFAIMSVAFGGGVFGQNADVALPSEEEIGAATEIAAEVEQEKALEAQQRRIAAKKHAEDADKASLDGNYDEAIEDLTAAVAADPENETYQEKLRLARVMQIHAALTAKNFDEAKELSDQFLKDYPGDAQVTRFREQAIEAIESPEVIEAAPAQPPLPATEAPITAEQLVAEAEDYILKKDYRMALDNLLEAHDLSPFDIKTSKRIKQVEEMLTRYERAHYAALRQELLTEIYAAWNRRPRRKVKLEDIAIQPAVEPSPHREKIRRKLETIIPQVEFENAKLKEVVDYLSKEAEVNIVIDPVVFTGYTPTTTGFDTMTGNVPGTYLQPGGPTTTPGTMFPGPTGPGPTPGTDIFDTGPGVTPGVTPGTTPGATPGVTGPTSNLFVAPTTDTGIRIKLENVPLKEVLRYVLRYKNLKYVVEDYAIVIVPVDWVPLESLETEVFRLATTGFGNIERPTLGPGSSLFDTGTSAFDRPTDTGGGPTDSSLLPGETEPTGPQTIKDFLVQSGVLWPRGSNIIYNSRTGTLIVTNTPTNMVLIRELVNLWDQPAMQVEIEARFVELLHTRWFENSFELGMLSPLSFTQKATGAPIPPAARKRYEFDLQPQRGTRFFPTLRPGDFPTPDADQILSLRGFMTEPEFQFIWHAIDQKDYSDLLSAPRVATISGQQAQIEVVQELTYPTEYDTETINIGGGLGGTTNLISGEVFMVTPGNWETRDVGIILNVTPSVSADGKMITLILMPEVTDLIQWINYGTDFYPIQQPVFESRAVTTSVHVSDGETIVLGGLITDKTTTYEDKVPLLGSIPFIGRFFRTAAETSSKANLVIFVTARLITSKGTELAQERELTEQQRRFLDQKFRERKEEIGETSPGIGTTGIIE